MGYKRKNKALSRYVEKKSAYNYTSESKAMRAFFHEGKTFVDVHRTVFNKKWVGVIPGKSDQYSSTKTLIQKTGALWRPRTSPTKRDIIQPFSRPHLNEKLEYGNLKYGRELIYRRLYLNHHLYVKGGPSWCSAWKRLLSPGDAIVTLKHIGEAYEFPVDFIYEWFEISKRAVQQDVFYKLITNTFLYKGYVDNLLAKKSGIIQQKKQKSRGPYYNEQH